MFLSILVSAFWIGANSFNVYDFAVVGAIFEMASITMLFSIFAIPVISIIMLFRKKTRKIFPAVSLVITMAALIYLNFFLVKPTV